VFMFALITTVALLSVLYGLAWHNEPARQPVIVRRPNRKQEAHD